MVKRFGFGEKEKLKSRKKIDELFAKGKSFTVSPIRVSYQFILSTDETVLQAGVTVGKKYFKKAVDRNRIKRLLREAYRLQKNELKETMKQKSLKGYVFFMYTDKEIASFTVIKEAMNKCLLRLQKKTDENHS
jgi:ribonuclease P protein component